MVTRPSASRSTCSARVAPSAWATPPSTWPRHCSGFMTVPASAVCTLRRIRISPVPRVDGDPEPLGVERDRPRAAAPVALGASRPPPRRAISLQRRARRAGRRPAPAPRIAARRSRAGVQHRPARPTTTPVDANAPVSWRTTSVSDWRTVIRSGVVSQGVGGDLRVHGGAAVAELGGADRDLVPAVGGQRGGGVGVVPAGRTGRDHRDRHALTDPPPVRHRLGRRPRPPRGPPSRHWSRP